MLKPTEIVAGALENARPLSLALARSNYEHRALVFAIDDKKFGLLLEGPEDLLHHVVECRSEVDWNGALISGVEIELDPESIYDVNGYYPPRGSLIRQEKSLAVQTSLLGNRFAHHGGAMAIMGGLPDCELNQRICFTRWQIVLGQGFEKRILHTVDVTTTKS